MATQMRIKTALTNVENDLDRNAVEIIRLIRLYIPEFLEVYYGHRPIGAEDIVFPCAMVEPIRTPEELKSLAKYDIEDHYEVYFYFLDNEREALMKRASDAMACLKKLFSNNALNDISAGHSTKFFNNPGYWYEVKVTAADISPAFKWAKNEQAMYCRAGLFGLNTLDRQIK
jgi:hypothetical protein